MTQHKNTSPKSSFPQFHLTKAYCAAQRKNLDWFFGQLTCCPRHARLVLLGERKGSAKLLESMRKALGPDGWEYACGLTAVLRADAAPTVEAQP